MNLTIKSLKLSLVTSSHNSVQCTYKGGKTINRKIIVTLIFCLSLILSACSQGDEEIEEFSGIIGEGKAMGYEYTVTKEAQSFSWKIGYKGDITTIEQDNVNEVKLQNFMTTVEDSKILLSKLIISIAFFLFVLVTSLFLFKRNRKKFYNGGVVIVVLAGMMALFYAIDASTELNTAIRDTKLYYLRLTSS